jgi:hypothetical protein
MDDAKRPSILAPPGGLGNLSSLNTDRAGVGAIAAAEPKPTKSPAKIPDSWPESSVEAARALTDAWDAEEYYDSILMWSESDDEEDPNITFARSVHRKYAQASAKIDAIPDEKNEKSAMLKWCHENMPKAVESLEKWRQIQRGLRVVDWSASTPPPKANSDAKQ